MRRETQNLLLMLLGGALLKIAFTGTYLRYVKPSLLPWLVLAGAVMVVLAAVAIARDLRASRAAALQAAPVRASADPPGETGPSGETGPTSCGAGAGSAAAHHGGHEHGSRSPWMLLLPVFAIFLVAPPPLGSDSVARAGDQRGVPERPGPASSRFPPLPAGPAPLLTISEFTTRVVWDSASLDHRTVRLRGFLVHPDGTPERSQLARMRISCCAADASPALIDLTGPPAAELASTPADTWVEVTGRLRAGSTESIGQVPTFDLTAVHEIPAPRDPYEY